MTRPDGEIIKKIYYKQKTNSCRGDWYELLKKDFIFIGETLDDEFVSSFDHEAYKKYIKNKVKQAAFKYYKSLQSKHSKIKKYNL